EKEHKDVEQMKRLTLKSLKAKLSGKYETKLEKEESEFLRSYHDLQEEQREFESLSSELQALKDELHKLRGTQKLVNSLVRRICAIESTVFDGPTPCYPTEDHLEQQTKRLQNDAARLQSLVNRQHSALRYINDAIIHWRHSQSHLYNAETAATADLFFDSIFLDINKHNDIVQAQRELELCKQKFQAAFKVYPELRNCPGRDELSIHISKPNLIVDVLFDNMFTDFHIRNKIKESLGQLGSAYQMINQCKNNLELSLKKSKLELIERQSLFEKSVKRLNSLRKEIIIRWIKSQKYSEMVDAPPSYYE
ncbi:hypothetical protein BKA69DRAFT_1039897, partial [Paraphysoderma sedebokerense]